MDGNADSEFANGSCAKLNQTTRSGQFKVDFGKPLMIHKVIVVTSNDDSGNNALWVLRKPGNVISDMVALEQGSRTAGSVSFEVMFDSQDLYHGVDIYMYDHSKMGGNHMSVCEVRIYYRSSSSNDGCGSG